ncbi:MAG: hypothetical protein JO006_09155 [Paucibacter sp.]|nr:hypothetical protein [Roseateles sp.]
MNAIKKASSVVQARSGVFLLGERNIAFAGVFALAMFSSVAAFAGQDTLEASAHDKQSEAAEAHQWKPVVLPLDHGPRADTTPLMNKRRLEKIRAERAALAASKPDLINKK